MTRAVPFVPSAMAALQLEVRMVWLGISIPFWGTVLGSAIVFLMKGSINRNLEKLLLGFASGVMIAASVWSLLIPSIEMADGQGQTAWIPAASGFFIGILFLLLLNTIISKFQIESEKQKKMQSHLGKTGMLVLVVTLHNLPEGMAVGVTFAGALIGHTGITMAGAFVLALGIAIQNLPEGAIISMPLCGMGMSRKRAFVCGVLSGAVEPLGAMLTIFLTGFIVPLLPYFLSFAAGAMIYVVVEELIPELKSDNPVDIGVIGVAVGFTLMMVLDVALG